MTGAVTCVIVLRRNQAHLIKAGVDRRESQSGRKICPKTNRTFFERLELFKGNVAAAGTRIYVSDNLHRVWADLTFRSPPHFDCLSISNEKISEPAFAFDVGTETRYGLASASGGGAPLAGISWENPIGTMPY